MKKSLFNAVFILLMAIITAPAIATPLVLLTTHYPPFSYEENGQQKGIAVDLVKEAFNRMHEEINIVFLPLSRAAYMVKNGEADAVFPFSKNEKRLTFTRYPAESLVTQATALFVRTDSPIKFDGDLAKLSQYTFGIERGANQGSDFAAAVQNHIIVHIDEADSQLHNVAKLLAGRFEIAVGPEFVIYFYAKQAGQLAQIKELKPSVDKPIVAYVGFSAKKVPAALIQRFDQTFKKMRMDGTYDKIFHNYGLNKEM